MTKYLPEFIIAGFNRCGTSTLHELLDRHPHLSMSRPKELHYYHVEKNYKQGADFYKAPFSHCFSGQIKGESTPSYIYKGMMFETGVEDYIWKPEDDSLIRLARQAPKTKIIISLRHPVKAAHSNFNKAKLHGREPQDMTFLKALEEEWEGRRSPQNTYLCHFYVTCYSLHLAHLLSLFPREQVLFLLFEEWTQNQQATLDKISDFLGVERQSLENTPFVKSNEGRQEMVGFLRSWLACILPDNLAFSVFRRLGTKSGYDELPEDLISDLLKKYEGDIVNTQNLTDLDLSPWRGKKNTT